MTREEALVQLRLGPGINEDVSEEYNDAVDMAIKALQQQPSEDEKVIRIKKGTLKARTGKYVIYDVEWLKTHFNTTEAKIYGQSKEEGARGDIPLQQSVPKMPQPSEHTEERTEMHACDCISRKAIIDALHRHFADGFDSDKWWNSTYVLGAINEVPSTQPKTGHWTHDGGYWKNRWICSECGYKLYDEQSRFCPDCGSYNGGKK